MYWEAYKVAKSVPEVFAYLQQFDGRARVIAGGTDLIVQLQEAEPEPGLVLIDISSIADIRGIELAEAGKWVVVGAATTMTELEQSALITKYGRALGLGSACVGSPQIRNVATIGGNVVNAYPAADGAIPLLALGAEARIVSISEDKWIPLEELFVDVGKSSVNSRAQLLTHFRFPPTPLTGASSLERLAKRRAFTLPTLVVAACLELDRSKRFFEHARLAAGPVAKTPWLATAAMERLRGSPVTREAIETASACAMDGAHPRNSLRGGMEYRKDMVGVLVKRAIHSCLNDIGVIL